MSTKDINLHELNSWEREAWAKFCSLTEYHKLFEIIQAQVPLGIRRAVKHEKKEFVERRISQIIDEGFWTKQGLNDKYGWLVADVCKRVDIACVLSDYSDKIILFDIKRDLGTNNETKGRNNVDDIHKAFGQCLFYRDVIVEDYPVLKENVGIAIICRKFSEPLYIDTLTKNGIDIFELESERWVIDSNRIQMQKESLRV